jgi:hypothetical protein
VPILPLVIAAAASVTQGAPCRDAADQIEKNAVKKMGDIIVDAFYDLEKLFQSKKCSLKVSSAMLVPDPATCASRDCMPKTVPVCPAPAKHSEAKVLDSSPAGRSASGKPYMTAGEARWLQAAATGEPVSFDSHTGLYVKILRRAKGLLTRGERKLLQLAAARTPLSQKQKNRVRSVLRRLGTSWQRTSAAMSLKGVKKRVATKLAKGGRAFKRAKKHVKQVLLGLPHAAKRAHKLAKHSSRRALTKISKSISKRVYKGKRTIKKMKQRVKDAFDLDVKDPKTGPRETLDSRDTECHKHRDGAILADARNSRKVVDGDDAEPPSGYPCLKI